MLFGLDFLKKDSIQTKFRPISSTLIENISMNKFFNNFIGGKIRLKVLIKVMDKMKNNSFGLVEQTFT